MARQATDSFVIELAGAPTFVSKGEILPEGHPVVKAVGDTHLFRKLIEDKPPAATPRKTAAPKAAE
jgi:hypothetical protein